MSKGLDELKAMCERCHRHIQEQPSKGMLPHKECPWRHISNDYCDEYETVRKNLMALEIIKATGILAVFETIGNERTLETMLDKVKLTKENYDLLKEVLS